MEGSGSGFDSRFVVGVLVNSIKLEVNEQFMDDVSYKYKVHFRFKELFMFKEYYTMCGNILTKLESVRFDKHEHPRICIQSHGILLWEYRTKRFLRSICIYSSNRTATYNDGSVNSPIHLDVPNEEIGESVTIAEELSAKLQKYAKNIRITHLNINSVAGFKFAELKFFIQENLFDIIVLSEAKIDDAFRDSQFYIKGSRMLATYRGLLIYVRRELIINRLCDFECKRTETITFSMQQKRTTKKIMVIAAYRPPCLSRSLWTQDLGDLLLRIRNRYDNIIVVGDLNCDLSDPDKHDKQGRGLLDLMEVCNMSNMIKQPTRVTTSSSSLIDVILTTSPRLF